MVANEEDEREQIFLRSAIRQSHSDLPGSVLGAGSKQLRRREENDNDIGVQASYIIKLGLMHEEKESL
jgi:hypothetical protein